MSFIIKTIDSFDYDRHHKTTRTYPCGCVAPIAVPDHPEHSRASIYEHSRNRTDHWRLHRHWRDLRRAFCPTWAQSRAGSPR
ncbi:hypothetical protein EMIT0357P_60079 [Pseudomonas marginalis]